MRRPVTEQPGIKPYGLIAPQRVLVPKFHCMGRPHDTRTLILGQGEEHARFTRHDYGRCRNGCCEPGTYIVLSVPCDAMPHCGSCECGSEHERTLSDEEIRQLKGLLP
jgi:hypothetical protein